jgi:hypothetical protein
LISERLHRPAWSHPVKLRTHEVCGARNA